MKSQMKLAAASLVLAGLMTAAACTPKVETGDPVAAAAPAASADIYPFKVGALDVVALRDGSISDVPNDNKVLGVGRTPAEVAAVLTANGLPGDSFSLSVQPLLVRDGARVVLLDAGAGNSFGPGAGKLPASLVAAGVQPNQITDVLISHTHADHVTGLVNASGGLTFPNATIRMAAAEWEFMKADAAMKSLVDTITPKVETFEPGAAALTPSISSVAINGHTPGHMGYEIKSGTDSLLYIGDTMHHSVISVQRPEWQIAFDSNGPTATASREAMLERAASQNLRVYAFHFPFPGLGRIQRKDDGFVWAPETAVQP